MNVNGLPQGSSVWGMVRQYLPWVLFLGFFALYPIVFDSPSDHTLGIKMMWFAIAATGWNMLGGFAGQISLGHATFFGVGAYAVALADEYEWNPWLAMILGMGVAAIIAVIIGWPVFRLKGHYFTIATIGTGEIAFLLVRNSEFLGGTEGFLMRSDEGFLNFYWGGRQKWEFYYLGFVLLLLAVVSTVMISKSRMGYYLQAIRNNQEAASSLGVPIAKYKQLAFIYSAVFVSIAGSYFAQQLQFAGPDEAFSLDTSIRITIIAVIGGVLSKWGPMIGAIVFLFLSEWTNIRFGGNGFDLVIFGFIVMTMAAFEPNGLIGLGNRFAHLLEKAKS